MTDLTNAAESLLMKWLMTADSPTRPTAWFVALHTADPTEAGATGELSGNGYSRQACDFTETTGTATNDDALTFGPNTSSNWGAVTHISIWTASTSGACLWKGALAASKAIAVGDSLTLAAGDIDLTLD